MLFIFDREREIEHEWGREREGDTESAAGSRLRAGSTEPDAGGRTHEPRDHDLSRSRRLNRWSPPRPPCSSLFDGYLGGLQLELGGYCFEYWQLMGLDALCALLCKARNERGILRHRYACR